MPRMGVAREILRLTLLIPGVIAASFAAAGHFGGLALIRNGVRVHARISTDCR